MSYKNLVGKQIENAFRLAKDLAVPVSLNRTGSSTFNFGTGLVEETGLPSVNTRMILMDDKSPPKTSESKSRIKNALIKTKGIGDVSVFDSIVEGTTNWKINKVILSTPVTALVELSEV